MDDGGGAVFGFLFFLVFAAMVGGFVFWIFKLLEVVRIPDHQYQAAGTEKVTWILVVALAQAIGAFIWHFAKRREVLDAGGRMPGTPPGWYPEPDTGTLRWWDGTRWTDHRQP